MQKTMIRIDDVIRWTEDSICIVTLVGIVGISTASVIARYIFHTGIFWADEVNQVLLVAMAMFGSARAVRVGGHTEFTTLSSKPKSKKNTNLYSWNDYGDYYDFFDFSFCLFDTVYGKRKVIEHSTQDTKNVLLYADTDWIWTLYL